MAVLNAAKLALGLIIATLKSIQAKIEPTSAARKAAVVSVNGVKAAGSKRAFVSQFNKIMADNGQPCRVK